jgi:hypothetical protein
MFGSDALLLAQDAQAEQHFFINRRLLRQVTAASTQFVMLSPTIALVDCPPTVSEMLDHLRESEASQSTYTSSDGLTPSTLVPLAAVLLEYRVAYIPPDEPSTAILAQEPLDVYACTATWTTEEVTKEHIIVKFSCPQVLRQVDADLVPASIADRLQRTFESRIQSVEGEGVVSVTIQHSTQTLDRVAL